MKVLSFDHNGYCMLYERLHGALFELLGSSDRERPLTSIDARALARYAYSRCPEVISLTFDVDR